MTASLKLALCAGISFIALGACSDDDDDGGAPPPGGGGGAGSLEENFGPQFAILFRANANSDPADPTPTSVIPVSFTTDPVPVP